MSLKLYVPLLVNNGIKMIEKWIEKCSSREIKTYIHFDIAKKIKKSREVTYFRDFFSEKEILSWRFSPFIRYNVSEKRFTLTKEESYDLEKDFFKDQNRNHDTFWIKRKDRPITYSSHRDSLIYSYYNYILEGKYETFLEENNLRENIIAYRHVEKEDGVGKNNIDFSKDAFQKIIDLEDCIVLAFDISWFFDNLEHETLKISLKKILKESSLKKDWYKVYKSITKFTYVNLVDLKKNKLIQRISWPKSPKRVDLEKLLTNFKDLIKKYPDWDSKNERLNKWIPQWSPISWMFANVYANEFDIWLKKYSSESWWYFFRYSDDIFIIIPIENHNESIKKCTEISNEVIKTIENKLKLTINSKKTEIGVFQRWKLIKNIIFRNWKFIFSDYLNPIEYLGFSFDGKRILIKNKTLSKFYRKMHRSIKRLAFLKKKWKKWFPEIKWWKIQFHRENKRFLFNGKFKWEIYKKKGMKKWQSVNTHYLGFIGYAFFAEKEYEPFCEKNNLSNWIRRQVRNHKKIYLDLVKQLK